MGKTLTPKTTRLDPDKVKKAEEAGLDLNELFRIALDVALDTQTCPCCGSAIKTKPQKK